MSIIIKSGSSGTLANVDANNNLNVNLPAVATQAGFTKQTDVNAHSVSVSPEGRVNTGRDTLLFYEPTDGAALNTNNWTVSQLTMTQAVTSGFLVLNSAPITTNGTYSIVTSNKSFEALAEVPLKLRIALKTPNTPQASATMEFGFGTAVATTVAPTLAGAYFRYANDGTFRAVANWGGSEVQSSVLTVPSINQLHCFDIRINHMNVEFFVDDVLVATITPSANAHPMDPTHLPIFARVYSTGTPALAPQLLISHVAVTSADADLCKNWRDQSAGMSKNIVQSPVTTFSQVTQWANTTQPTTFTPVNIGTGAFTTLGGEYIMNSVATGATDLVLFAYQVPAGYQLYLTDMWITAMNTGAAVAVSATVLQWGLAVNSSAVSMATADSAGTTWQPRRIPIGSQAFPIAAAIGAVAPDIVRTFTTPIVCDSGRYVHVFFKPVIGTATASQTITGVVGFTGYFE
jgi:hypothetical protein